MPRLDEVAALLDDYLRTADYPDERNGVQSRGDRWVERLGVALDPPADLHDWIRSDGLDAVLLHRTWSLAAGGLPTDVGLLAYHLPFDEKLTHGFNPPLADALGLMDPVAFGSKQGRPLGMLGDVGEAGFDELVERVLKEFGGVEDLAAPRAQLGTGVAVVGAMTDALVREAAARGASTYLTGQFRAPARRAVLETGIGVVATGHRRSEQWGMRALVGLLRTHWPELRVSLRID